MTGAPKSSGDPATLNALAALAQREHQAGRLAEAAEAYCQILAIRPDVAEVHNDLGIVLAIGGKFDEAAQRFREAIALKENLAVAHFNLGNVLSNSGNPGEAIARFERAVALRPDYAEARNNLALALRRQGRLEEAVAQLEQTIALQPNFAVADNNLGDILTALGQLDQAVVRFRRAIALRPDYAEAHSNLANVLVTQGKLDEAVAHFRQALSLNPGLALAEMGLSVCFLIQGDFERGWPAYEARLRLPQVKPQPRLRRWQGEPLAGRRLLLLGEQGLGDTIQFLRYARLLRAQGAQVILAAQPALGRLLASHPDLDELFLLDSAGEMPQVDFYLPLLSVPGALRTTASTIPAEVPYLSADPGLSAHWRQELARIDRFKIGIAWQGSPTFSGDRWRSIPLAKFAPLARQPGVQLISLQKGFGSEQIAKVEFPVLDLANRLDDAAGPFMDTAAVIQNLDLVVTSDTAIAHLAGALGVPVWVALQRVPDWRFMRDRDDSPWYPTMRLFRQTTLGDWADVFERIAAAVGPLSTGKSP